MSRVRQDPMEIIASGIDLSNRTIYIIGLIDANMAAKVVVALAELEKSPQPIRIVMESCGGSVPYGYAIYEAIKLSPCLVQIEVLSACQSIAALILQGGDIRLMSPEARFMVHNGTVEIGATNSDTLHAVGKEVKRESERYAQILADRSGTKLDVVRKMCIEETYLSAEEACKYGFADGMLVFPDKKVPKPRKRRRKKK